MEELKTGWEPQCSGVCGDPRPVPARPHLLRVMGAQSSAQIKGEPPLGAGQGLSASQAGRGQGEGSLRTLGAGVGRTIAASGNRSSRENEATMPKGAHGCQSADSGPQDQARPDQQVEVGSLGRMGSQAGQGEACSLEVSRQTKLAACLAVRMGTSL